MMNRRRYLAALAGSMAWIAAPSRAAGRREKAGSGSNFQISGTYLNAAYTHPLPLDAAAAAREYLAGRCDPDRDGPPARRDANALFARLVNASAAEIAGIPSTSFGESFVAGSLGLFDDPGAGIVTDVLHYDGSLYMYGELAKRGNPVTVLPMGGDGRIDMNRMERAIVPGTRLVAISQVSMINGFQHDIRTVCELAHRKGARVYVDAIQGAGAVPLDVRASGVDFVACASFKWLMGDFGYGFLFAREDLLPTLGRRQYGYHQIKGLAYHAFPGDQPGNVLFEATPTIDTASGYFELGSMGTAAQVAVSVSLRNILDMGVANVQRKRQPLMDRLRERLSTRYQPLTPEGATSPIISFTMPGADRLLASRIRDAGVNIELYDTRFRISPSVYNTMADIDRVIDVLLA